MKILAADDDPVNRRRLQVTLEQWGHEVVVVADGIQALEALRAEGAPSLAIIDWMMPGLTGPEVCRELRAQPELRGTYVILLTARGEREDIVTGLHGGADDFMTKPFDREILRARLSVGERVLDLQRALCESNARLREHGEQLEAAVAARTSELSLAHRELTAACQVKDRILTSVHHELRTPVTKLMMVGQCLERVRPGSTPPASMLSTLVQQTKHLAGLLDQVLSARALMAPSDDDDELDAHVDLLATVEAVAFWSQDIAAARQVRIEIQPHWPAMRIPAGASRLALVLRPILENAVKFTRPDTTVRIGFDEAAAGRVAVTITDEGPGVRPEDAERIFGEFDQGSGDALVAKPMGLGLGLAIARRQARRLGGDVSVRRGPRGSGATFCVELPVEVALPSKR